MGQFTGNILQISVYLLTTYGKFSLSQLNYFEKEVTQMNYELVTPIKNISNKVKDLLEYGNIKNCPYSHPQTISKVYSIILKTGKPRESINAWNHLPPIQKTWIAFKTHFCEALTELTKTGELNLEQDGYRQAKTVEEIISPLSAKFQHQANMVKNAPPLKIQHQQLQQELQKFCSKLPLRTKS